MRRMILAVAALLSIPLLLSRGSMSTEELMAGGALASNLAFLAGEDASPSATPWASTSSWAW